VGYSRWQTPERLTGGLFSQNRSSFQSFDRAWKYDKFGYNRAVYKYIPENRVRIKALWDFAWLPPHMGGGITGEKNEEIVACEIIKVTNPEI
jgi:hypothetical protein